MMTRCDLKLSCDTTFNCGKIFIERYLQEFIFEEKGLFEISENKNPSKIMRYTVWLHISLILMQNNGHVIKR